MNREEKEILAESRSRSGAELAREVAGGLDDQGWGWGSIKRGLRSSVTAPLKAAKYSLTIPYRGAKAYLTNKPGNLATKLLSTFRQGITLEQLTRMSPALRKQVQKLIAAGKIRLA